MTVERRWNNDDLEFMKFLDRRNMTRREIRDRLEFERGVNLSIERLGQILGRRQRATGRKSVQVTILPSAVPELQRLAKDLGYEVHFGDYVGHGSISLLLEAIASGELRLTTRANRLG
jgi:hypothetical protein